jgi:hypothetical protein
MKRKRLTYSRPDKLNDFYTVAYEIDMLRFAAGRLLESDWKNERDAWVYLEAFLLHYRNLIEFLGKDVPSKTDLHVMTIWEKAGVAAPDGIEETHKHGKRLWARYEPKDADGGCRISQYLHHCTTKRTDSKEWQINEMNEQIEPLLKAIDRHLRPEMKPLLKPVFPAEFPRNFAASTTVATHTAVLPVLIDGVDYLPVGKPKKGFDEK